MTAGGGDDGLAGRVAVITGSTSGLGRATAELFARRGAHVVGAARRARLGNEIAETLRAEGASASFVEADVRRVADCRRLVETALERHGCVDILVNNAGFEGDPPVCDSHLATEEHWDDVMDTNLKGAFFCASFCLKSMQPTGRGVILNVSSINALSGPAKMAAYSASKAGLVQLSRTLAVEYALDGIRVNAVVVGGVDTPQAERTRRAIAEHMRGGEAPAGPRRRNRLVYEPVEVARVLALLCRDDADITGATIAVDRGMSAGTMVSTMIYMTSSGLWEKPY